MEHWKLFAEAVAVGCICVACIAILLVGIHKGDDDDDLPGGTPA